MFGWALAFGEPTEPTGMANVFLGSTWPTIQGYHLGWQPLPDGRAEHQISLGRCAFANGGVLKGRSLFRPLQLIMLFVVDHCSLYTFKGDIAEDVNYFESLSAERSR